MPRSRSLGIDPLSGIEVIFHDGHDAADFHVEHRQDVEPILAQNAEWRKNAEGGFKGDGWHHVARIPWVKILELSEKFGFISPAGDILDQKAYNKWVNSTDAIPYRVRGGTI